MRVPVAVLMALVTLFAACGDEPAVTTGNIVTAKERYIRQADAVCSDFHDAVMGTAVALRDASPAKRRRLTRELRRLADRAERKIEALPRPEENRAVLERYIALSRERGPSEPASPKLRRTADQYGFDACPL